MNKEVFKAVAKEIIDSMKTEEDRVHLSEHCAHVEAFMVADQPCWYEILATIIVASKIINEGGPKFVRPRRRGPKKAKTAKPPDGTQIH